MLRAAYLRALLKALEERLPPPRHPDAVAASHHGITFCRYGSDDTGWTDKLGLHIHLADPFRSQTIFVEDADLEKPVDVVVSEICGLLNIFPGQLNTAGAE